MADVASNIYDWSTTASSNSPSDATSIGAGLADNFQQIQATVRAAFASKGADIASATTTDLGAVAGKQHDITGTTTITGFGTVAAGIEKLIQFDGILTLTHNATSLILPGGANITTAAGDVALMVSEGSGNWRCAFYQKASGAPVTMKQITNSLSGDVALNNTANFFDGPSVAQGTAWTWFASGNITVTDGAAAGVYVKLWDGTTVIASTYVEIRGANVHVDVHLSGYLASPAGNIRISARNITSITGVIEYDAIGAGKSSTLSAIRIG